MIIKNILVIDDDPVSHFIAEQVIRASNKFENIDRAFNGKEGLTMLEEYCDGLKEMPGLILVDLHMPIMDGFQFVKIFSEMECMQGIKLAVLSSSDSHYDKMRLNALGVKRFVKKPMTNYLFDELLREFVDVVL